MPLPPDSSLSLVTQQNAKRHAYILKMSQEAFDAIANAPAQPQIQLDLSDKPGFHVDNRFFPLRTSDSSNHELYLRTSFAAKKNNPPLKLFADIVGKLAIERDLESISEGLRETAQDVVNQRERRKTVPTDPPLDLAPKPIKREKDFDKLFRNPLRPSDKLKPAPTAAPSSGPSKQSPKEINPHLRRQIIHLVALGEKTFEQVATAVALPSSPSPATNAQILDALVDVAEPSPVAKGQSSSKATKLFRLKPTTWKEVRPYDWPGLSENERTVMARSARLNLKALGIPESESAWEYVRFRGSSSQAGDRSNSTAKEAVKRGLMTLPKEKKASKLKPDLKPDPSIKTDGPRASSSTPAHRRTDSASDSSARRPTDRKPSAPTDSTKVVGRGSKQPQETNFLPEGREREKDRKRDPLAKVKKPTREDTPPVKRRIDPDDEHETSSNSGAKRRKVESPPSMSRTPSTALSTRPIKQEEPERTNIARKRELLPQIQKSRSDDSSRDRDRRASSVKSRPVPVYTSSEDEGDEKPKALGRQTKASSSRPTAPEPSATTSSKEKARRVPRSLPSDHASLRALYETSYIEYLDVFQKLLSQKSKMDRLLKRAGVDRAGSITDSDSDTQLLSPEEFYRLKANHDDLHEELESIKHAFVGQ